MNPGKTLPNVPEMACLCLCAPRQRGKEQAAGDGLTRCSTVPSHDASCPAVGVWGKLRLAHSTEQAQVVKT